MPARPTVSSRAALARARPGTGERVAPLLGPPAPTSFQGLVTALINDLAGEEALLVLDDYHVISAPQVHESLSFLVEHRPAGICVVLASRSDPPLPADRDTRGRAAVHARGGRTSGHFEVVEPLLDAVACAPPGWADEPFEPAGGAAASNLINVPALTTLVRSFVAQYHGDAEATAAFATQTLAKIKPGERLLSANAQIFLAVAEWLRGRLTGAERAIAVSVTGWREAGQLTMAAWS